MGERYLRYTLPPWLGRCLSHVVYNYLIETSYLMVYIKSDVYFTEVHLMERCISRKLVESI
jgi:hypothetical protein